MLSVRQYTRCLWGGEMSNKGIPGSLTYMTRSIIMSFTETGKYRGKSNFER